MERFSISIAIGYAAYVVGLHYTSTSKDEIKFCARKSFNLIKKYNILTILSLYTRSAFIQSDL